jgi:hypothetical protein
MVSGTSHFSGVNPDYIRGIFDGSVNPPFVQPLNCIEPELLSFYSYVQNLTDIVVPELEGEVIPSPSKLILVSFFNFFEFNSNVFFSQRDHSMSNSCSITNSIFC